MVYDWDAHQETCYQLYIEEGRSLEDIMEHMKSVHKFAPSKRAFQTQFRRWNFPSKQKPAYKNDRLVSRIKELWEKNLAQREMLRVLNEEDGFDIKARELMRVRTRNRWLLRVPNGDKSKTAGTDDDVESVEDGSSVMMDDMSTVSLSHDHEASSHASQGSASMLSPEPDLELSENVDSPDQLEKKKRKRNRLKMDPSGAIVRFPSEMTIDEARLLLSLDMATYRNLRSTFQQICHEHNVVKKTLAGPEKWEQSKSCLINVIPELQQVLWLQKDNPEPKRLALDVICTDVTKRMRMQETRMTLAEAKNSLGVNPQESREIRIAFHEVLCDAQFTCKSDATPQQWEDLKHRWGERSELIKKILDDRDGGSDSQKLRALEVMARDVMKRLRDDRGRKDMKKHQTQPIHVIDLSAHDNQQHLRRDEMSHQHSSPHTVDQLDLGDGLTPSTFDDMSEVSHHSHLAFSPDAGDVAHHLQLTMPSQASSLADHQNALPQPSRVLGSSIPTGMQLDSQISSSLLMATTSEAAFLDQSYVTQYGAPPPPSHVFHHHPPPVSTMAVFIRLHPSSTFVPDSPLWIDTINSHSIQQLRQVAAQKFPGALCLRVEGILKFGKEELPLQIEQDQELAAYLAHAQSGPPTFSVQLV